MITPALLALNKGSIITTFADSETRRVGYDTYTYYLTDEAGIQAVKTLVGEIVRLTEEVATLTRNCQTLKQAIVEPRSA